MGTPLASACGNRFSTRVEVETLSAMTPASSSCWPMSCASALSRATSAMAFRRLPSTPPASLICLAASRKASRVEVRQPTEAMLMAAGSSMALIGLAGSGVVASPVPPPPPPPPQDASTANAANAATASRRLVAVFILHSIAPSQRRIIDAAHAGVDILAVPQVAHLQAQAGAGVDAPARAQRGVDIAGQMVSLVGQQHI